MRTDTFPHLCLCAGCRYSFWAYVEAQMPDRPHCVVMGTDAPTYRFYRWLFDEDAIAFTANPDEVRREYSEYDPMVRV